jgi:hypothetical protein
MGVRIDKARTDDGIVRVQLVVAGEAVIGTALDAGDAAVLDC